MCYMCTRHEKGAYCGVAVYTMYLYECILYREAVQVSLSNGGRDTISATEHHQTEECCVR